MKPSFKSINALRGLILAGLLLAAGTPFAAATTVQTNYGTGDGTTPGGTFATSGNLLLTNLASASFTGSSYRSDSGYPVVVPRLYDNDLGPSGSSGLGNDGSYTLMPNIATIQFDLDGAFDITLIRTYASWDSGRSGQSYTVNYATASAPLTFVQLFSITPFNNDDSIFPQLEFYDPFSDEYFTYADDSLSSTMVSLTSTTGVLAADVVSLQFVFTGYQNGGTAFREFQVVPEPSCAVLLLGSGALLLLRRRRTAGVR
jgi:hypothetical protein